MAKHILDECLEGIQKNFRDCANKYEAHLKTYPILHRMSGNVEVTHEIFRRAMRKSNFISKFNCTPDISLVVLDVPEFFLFASFFGPNRERRTDISYSTMHHHDDFLLSTINVKGAGYPTLIFKKGYEIDRERMRATIGLEKYTMHHQGNIEFIDAHTCHTVFYPPEMTQTFALFSTHFPTNQVSSLRSHPFIQKNKAFLKKMMGGLNINPRAVANVGQYREDYFCPTDGELVFLPGQVLPKGADHYVQNFFHTAKEFAGFDDDRFLKDFFMDLKKDSSSDAAKIQWIERAIEHETIEREVDSYDMFVPQRNVPLSEYQKIYNIVE